MNIKMSQFRGSYGRTTYFVLMIIFLLGVNYVGDVFRVFNFLGIQSSVIIFFITKIGLYFILGFILRYRYGIRALRFMSIFSLVFIFDFIGVRFIHICVSYVYFDVPYEITKEVLKLNWTNFVYLISYYLSFICISLFGYSAAKIKAKKELVSD